MERNQKKMSLEKIKEKIISIKRNSNTSHYKVSVASLCDIVMELANELEKIQNPPLVTLTQIPDSEIKTGLPRKLKPMEVDPKYDVHNTKRMGSNHISKQAADGHQIESLYADGNPAPKPSLPNKDKEAN